MLKIVFFSPPLGISVTLRWGYGYFLELHNMETHQTLKALALFAIIYCINKVQQFILFAQEKSFYDFDNGSQLIGMASTGRRNRSKDHGNKNILTWISIADSKPRGPQLTRNSTYLTYGLTEAIEIVVYQT